MASPEKFKQKSKFSSWCGWFSSGFNRFFFYTNNKRQKCSKVYLPYSFGFVAVVIWIGAVMLASAAVAMIGFVDRMETMIVTDFVAVAFVMVDFDLELADFVATLELIDSIADSMKSVEHFPASVKL